MRNKKGYKLTEKTKRKIGLGNKGKKRSDKVKKEKSELMKNMWKRDNYRNHMIKVHKGQIPWCMGKKRFEMMGEKHFNWKGGQSPIRKQIRDSFEYRQWRSDIFTRDNFTCQNCGIKSGCGYKIYLVAHHIKSFDDILKEYKIMTLEMALDCAELWDINNSQTLCKKCHDKLHGLNKK